MREVLLLRAASLGRGDKGDPGERGEQDPPGRVAPGSDWHTSIARDPITLATRSMLMQPKDGSSPGVLITAIPDPETGLLAEF